MRNYSLFDNKTIVIERLSEPTTYDSTKMLVYLRFFDAEKFELSTAVEVFIPKDRTTVHELGVVAAKLFNTPVRMFLI